MYYGFRYRKVEGFRRTKVWFNEFQSVQDAQSYCEYATEWFKNWNMDFREEDQIVFRFDPFTVYYDSWTNQIIEKRMCLLDCWISWLNKNDPQREIYGAYLTWI